VGGQGRGKKSKGDEEGEGKGRRENDEIVLLRPKPKTDFSRRSNVGIRENFYSVGGKRKVVERELWRESPFK